MAYLNTQDSPCDYIDARDILVVKLESTGAGMGEKGLGASMGYFIKLYEKICARMEG